jgi:hypothetical protein
MNQIKVQQRKTGYVPNNLRNVDGFDTLITPEQIQHILDKKH